MIFRLFFLELEVFKLKENKIEEKIKFRKRHPSAFWGCIAILAFASIPIIRTVNEDGFALVVIVMSSLAVTAIITFLNICLIYIRPRDETKWKIKVRSFEVISIVVGLILSSIALPISARYEDWYVSVAYSENHSPVWTEAIPTTVFLFLIGILGYLILAFTNAKKTPPLITVLAISALYIGVFECVIWSIQVIKTIFLPILPINFIIIAGRLIREKALELKAREDENLAKKKGIIGWINRELVSWRFPIWALFLVFPLLGVVIVVLLLWGQRPDYIIKGYTETADWALSQKIAPPGYDNHYLCTVAAQGHKKLVKPHRIGIRHGRRTIVNRQLCIANAFEQILEERIPKTHRAIRKFYDTHGFPLSKLIKTKTAADFVYIVMKPLEWFFLIILYTFTSNPEERISRQYRK